MGRKKSSLYLITSLEALLQILLIMVLISNKKICRFLNRIKLLKKMKNKVSYLKGDNRYLFLLRDSVDVLD